MTSIGLGFIRGGGASAVAAANPLWLVTAASGQTGNAALGQATWQLGASTGVDPSDPTFATDRWAFDGGDYLEILHPLTTMQPLFGVADAFTYMVVAKVPSNPAGTQALLSARSGSSTGPGPRLLWLTAGTVQPSISDGTSNVSAAAVAAAAGVWNVIFYYSESVTAIRARVNGTTGATVARTGNSETPTMATTRICRIGSTYHTPGSFFVGDVKAAAAWQRQLTADEMTALEAQYGAGT